MQVFGSQGHIFKEYFTQQLPFPLLITSRWDWHLQILWFLQHDELCHKQITNTSVEMAETQTASLPSYATTSAEQLLSVLSEESAGNVSPFCISDR